ncbi:Uncharacterised protein [Acinetobacter baumannii]|uniref:hypothetical protein n=1 Tax=Acinetobacter baumannii TaxID=470 RepID=UPI000DE7BD36|nr:hypothetical protein [Acinetobacter baumannii]SSP36713.1 Uncharacterised protein [Acinetobacter baumannii]SSQ34122.1 Uncharacterised protein [Acinetobacter baumannii]SSQ39490.1 Uncharacterised protein [Acinetobacter baumannii]SVJ96325.1 Uncharacterised protein [Acinetobacter baumannii]
MLFNRDEIAALKYFKRIASDLNTYQIKFEKDPVLIKLNKQMNFHVIASLNLLKNILNNTESIIEMGEGQLTSLLIKIEIFEKKLNENLYNISRVRKDYPSYFKTLVTDLFDFLNVLLEWEQINKLYNQNKRGVLSSRPDFKELYNRLKMVINTLNERQFLFSNKFAYHNKLDLNDTIVVLEDRLNILSNKFDAFSDEFIRNKENSFNQQKVLLEKEANEVFIKYKEFLNGLRSQYKTDIDTPVMDLKNKLANNKADLDSLLGDVKLYQDKMTNKAVSEMSAHYYEKSKFEKISYFIVTGISALIIIGSVVSAYIGINSYYQQYVSTESCENTNKNENKDKNSNPKPVKPYEECINDLTVKRDATQKFAFNYLIFRLSFSVLLFLAVIYASRIAMRAYNHWRQSENMYLKLNTLSPFIGSLDKSVRNDVHLSLVPDYFGKDAGIVESSKDVVKDIPTNISNIAIKAIEQAGSTIGSKLGSDKETKNSDSASSTEKNKKKSEDESQ